MKTLLTADSEKPTHTSKPEIHKKRKNYTEQLLQFLTRQTNADRRVNIYGMDPFK